MVLRWVHQERLESRKLERTYQNRTDLEEGNIGRHCWKDIKPHPSLHTPLSRGTKCLEPEREGYQRCHPQNTAGWKPIIMGQYGRKQYLSPQEGHQMVVSPESYSVLTEVSYHSKSRVPWQARWEKCSESTSKVPTPRAYLREDGSEEGLDQNTPSLIDKMILINQSNKSKESIAGGGGGEERKKSSPSVAQDIQWWLKAKCLEHKHWEESAETPASIVRKIWRLWCAESLHNNKKQTHVHS